MTSCTMSVFLMYCNCILFLFFFFKQKTAYEIRISYWSSDVCSSDLTRRAAHRLPAQRRGSVCRPHRCVDGLRAPDRHPADARFAASTHEDRKSVVSGNRVSIGVYMRGGRNINKKN